MNKKDTCSIRSQCPRKVRAIKGAFVTLALALLTQPALGLEFPQTAESSKTEQLTTSSSKSGLHPSIVVGLHKQSPLRSLLKIDPQAAIESLSTFTGVGLQYTGQSIGEYHQFQVLSARGTEDVLWAIERLKGLSDIRTVEPNYFVHPTAFVTNDPGFDRFSATLGSTDPAFGHDFYSLRDFLRNSPNFLSNPPVVYVIDDGVGNSTEVPRNRTVSFSILNGRLSDAPQVIPSQHGEQIISLIAGVADNNEAVLGVLPTASIRSINVFGPSEGIDSKQATAFDVALSIQYAVNGHRATAELPANLSETAQVIHVSATAQATQCPAYMQAAVDSAVNAGAIVVASSGNQASRQSLNIPGSCQGAVSVGALDTQRLETAAFSNSTRNLTTLTLGTDIPILDRESDQGFSIGSGTSYSAALVTALVASAKSLKNSLRAQEVISAFSQTNRPAAQNDPCQRDGACAGQLDVRGFFTAATGITLPHAPTSGVAPTDSLDPLNPETSQPVDPSREPQLLLQPISGTAITSGQTQGIFANSVSFRKVNNGPLRGATIQIQSNAETGQDSVTVNLTEANVPYEITFEALQRTNTPFTQQRSLFRFFAEVEQVRAVQPDGTESTGQELIFSSLEVIEEGEVLQLDVNGNPTSGGGSLSLLGLLCLIGLCLARITLARQRIF